MYTFTDTTQKVIHSLEEKQPSITKAPDKSLSEYLTLQKPVVAQNSIEFKEVFSVPLSEEFYKAYKQVYNDTWQAAYNYNYSTVSHNRYLNDNILLVDSRPQLWYQQLRKIEALIFITTLDCADAEQNVKIAFEKIQTTKDEKEEKALQQARKNYLNLLQLASNQQLYVAELIKQHSGLIHFIERQNYQVKKNKENQYEISKVIWAIPDPIVTVSIGYDLVNETNWKDITTRLTKELPQRLKLPDLMLDFKDESSKLSLIEFNKANTNLQKKLEEEIEDEKEALRRYESKRAPNAPNKDANLNSLIAKSKETITTKTKQRDQELIQNLAAKRRKFIDYWNDPKLLKEAEFKIQPIDKKAEPLEELRDKLATLKKDNPATYEQHEFQMRDGGFYNSKGQSLREFMNLPNLDEMIIHLPVLDETGVPIAGVFRTIIKPRRPTKDAIPALPSIKFVETNNLQVGWNRYIPGPLIMTFNLLPGEEKEVMLERTTKISRTTQEARKQGQEMQARQSSSFEENLHDEMSDVSNVSQTDEASKSHSQQQSDATKTSTQSSQESSSQQSSSDTINVNTSANASFFFVSASMGLDFTHSSNQTNASNNKSAQSSAKESALAVASQEQGHHVSKNSRDTALKNVKNTVNRVASETSNANKMEISLSTTEEKSITESHKENTKLKNANIGYTVNYHFFQIQNVYKIKIQLEDVKIVINTGIELVAGSKLYDTLVVDLESFNQLYEEESNHSNAQVILFALLARKVLEHYTNFIQSDQRQAGENILTLNIANNGSLEERMKTINEIYSGLEPDNTAADSFKKLKYHLQQLKSFNFIFNPKLLIGESEYTINAPSTHVDAQLGQCHATESFYEEMRQAKLAKEIADTDNVRANTQLTLARTQFFQQYRPALQAQPALLANQQASTAPNSSNAPSLMMVLTDNH